MTIDYYLTGRDESKDVEYYLYLAPNLDVGRLQECKKWLRRFHELWEEGGSIPNKISLTNLPVDVLEYIVLFKRLTDACGDYKHFVASIILDWYGGTVADEFSINKKMSEDVRAVVVLTPDLSMVDIKENPGYRPKPEEPK